MTSLEISQCIVLMCASLGISAMMAFAVLIEESNRPDLYKLYEDIMNMRIKVLLSSLPKIEFKNDKGFITIGSLVNTIKQFIVLIIFIPYFFLFGLGFIFFICSYIFARKQYEKINKVYVSKYKDKRLF